MNEATNIAIATATVTGKISYPDGDGPGRDTYVPFSLTVGDNCCSEHASSAARAIMAVYADDTTTRFDEPMTIVFD